MRSKRRRKEVRNLARQAQKKTERRVPTAKIVREELPCRCGKLLSLSPEDVDKTFHCQHCQQRFKASRVASPSGGPPELHLFSLDDPSTGGSTFFANLTGTDLTASAAGTSAPTEVNEALKQPIPGPKGLLDDAIEPDPPERLAFNCPCGQLLEATKKSYDKRAICSRCKTRLLLSLIWDPSKKKHTIEPVRVSQPPTGNTGPILLE